MKHIYIIAEIGCNHCGDPKLAKKMVDEAKACGVDAVKFQTFKAAELISKYAPKADYQKVTTGNDENQLEMTRKLELPYDEFPSGEVTNLPFLEKIAKYKIPNKKIILSTGMCTIEEIHQAVDIICKYEDPKNLIILHCNTEYPTPDKDVNLSAIDTLHQEFPDIEIGFSDHSVGYVAAIGACMKNIVLIEKHFTLDKNLPGPDHKASATPEELKELCQNVRRIEVIAGEGGKKVTESERRNINIARKSIVARRAIKRGEIFTEDNITCKRPGNGISPMDWYNVLGTTAIRDFCEDELIER